MALLKGKKVLVSGASIAGLSTAWWLNKLGYNVTVVEIAKAPRTGGTAVDLQGKCINIVKRMGIYEQLKSNCLSLEKIEFKNENDETVNSISLKSESKKQTDLEHKAKVSQSFFSWLKTSLFRFVMRFSNVIEIERTLLVQILLDALKNNVEFLFNNSITELNETKDNIEVRFNDGTKREYEFVVGCDGIHSGVRKIWFGNEQEYTHFLKAYGSVSIVNKSLIQPNTMQFYNEPNKGYILNAYKDKTDIVLYFLAEQEIPYNYRDAEQQRNIIIEKFTGNGWRTAELLEEVKKSDNFYFDKLCQIKMPSWTKGRVVLVGDSAYCASPAAGMGGSLAMQGAATLADALQKHSGNFERAFQDYNKKLRPFIEHIQAKAELDVSKNWIPRTEEDIRKRNTEGFMGF
jgi:2-polyprenyl-6-methoxyphenol hydroxylase-like FAD-dependent oxidoreductase